MEAKYTEANTSSTAKKKERRGGSPLLIVITLLLVVVLGVQGFLVYSNMNMNQYVADQKRKEAEALEQENAYIEDGYKVGEQYEIRSTTHISDAYKSGDESALSAEDKETLNMAKKVIDEVIKDGMSNYEKEEAIYVWMVKNIGQGASTTVSLPGHVGGDQFTPHGVLSGSGAVCVGYATTFRLFMNMLGMDCHIVHNDYHSWDLVQLDDGEWYHTDIYSDATGTSSEPSYRNFNMDDAAALYSHTWDESALPEAKGVKYTAPNQKKKDLKKLVDVPAAVKKGFDEGQKVFYYQFDKITEDDYPVADYIVTQLQSALSASGSDGYVSGSWYNNEDESRGYILGLNIEVYTEGMSEGAQELPEEKRQALTDAINQAFGTEIGLDPYDYGYGTEENTDGPDGEFLADANAGAAEPALEKYEAMEGADKKEILPPEKINGSNDPNYYANEDGE